MSGLFNIPLLSNLFLNIVFSNKVFYYFFAIHDFYSYHLLEYFIFLSCEPICNVDNH